MGLTNPIEYFNDEYMPSFYFNRLEYWEKEVWRKREMEEGEDPASIPLKNRILSIDAFKEGMVLYRKV